MTLDLYWFFLRQTCQRSLPAKTGIESGTGASSMRSKAPAEQRVELG